MALSASVYPRGSETLTKSNKKRLAKFEHRKWNS